MTSAHSVAMLQAAAVRSAICSYDVLAKNMQFDKQLPLNALALSLWMH